MNAPHPDRWILAQLAVQLFDHGFANSFSEAAHMAVQLLAAVDAQLPPIEPSAEDLEMRDVWRWPQWFARSSVFHPAVEPLPKDFNDGI